MKIQRPEMRKARIEIIPMIDTIFFLLVFFMFSSLSMVQMQGLGVSLPTDSTVSTAPPPKAVVTVNASGQYFIGVQQIKPSDLQNALQAQVTTVPQTVIVINVAKTQNLQTLISVMDAANAVTLPNGQPAAVLIATQPVNTSGALENP